MYSSIRLLAIRQANRIPSLYKIHFQTPRFISTHNPQSPSSNPTKPAPDASPSTRSLPPRIQEAIHQISSFSEISQASTTADAQLATTLLQRILSLVTGDQSPTPTTRTRPSMGKNYEAVAHALLAQHAHRVGDVTNERAHRLDMITSIQQDADTGVSPDPYRALLSICHLSLSLCCLRAPGAESQLAAAAAATAAERLADSEQQRLTGALLAALAAGEDSPRRPVVLSALTAIGGDVEQGAVDVPGLARYFLATGSGSEKAAAVDQAKALVVRWEGRGGFDLVEALVAGAKVLIERDGGKHAMDLAEDFLGRALKEAEKVGNELDKSEPLLGLAALYMKTGRIVETEGLLRSVEERFEPLVKRMAFTVSSADLYCRNMDLFAHFLGNLEFNGKKRSREAEIKKEAADKVKQLYPLILNSEERPSVPLWFVDSVMPHFEMLVPDGSL